MSFSFIEHAAGPQSPEQTLLILAYEIGKILKCEEDIKILGSPGYKSAQCTEMGDTISMLRYYCEQTFQAYYSSEPSIKKEELQAWIQYKQLGSRLAIWVSNLIQSHHYTNMFGSHLYHNPIETCIANLRLLIETWTTLNGFNYKELEKLGEEHYLERMEHIRKDGMRK